IAASLDYLDTCDVCDPQRLLSACDCCDLHDKTVDVPELVLGFRAARQPDEAAQHQVAQDHARHLQQQQDREPGASD
ncbi:MAG TPA: hypothetical protein VH044_14580, partial [Polyangiaceae bacterium]|nr:hypothetical protein [Polyangiaceae bacterium]